MTDSHAEVMRLRKQLEEIRDAARLQFSDWMHFHEVAMVNPFRAEADAQAFCQRVVRLTKGLGTKEPSS